MVFSSTIFIFYFLPSILFLYFIVRKKLRNTVLLAASLSFYAWGEPRFIFVLSLSIAVNYLFGLFIEKQSKETTAKAMLVIGVGANLIVLFYYKYMNFAVFIWNRTIGQKYGGV